MKLNRFANYAWGVLAYNVAVILWGAYVRATGSGAGCGGHWPTCNGVIIPLAPTTKTLIEFSHRLSSGLALAAVVGLTVWAFRAYPKKHIVRKGAGASLALIIVEALLGAGLVLFGLVANDDSAARAISISLHLVNTFMLLAAITLTAWWASGGKPVEFSDTAVLPLAVGVLSMLALGVSGAIAALGDTLFPSTSLFAGLAQDFSASAHLFLRLRTYHPFIAIAVGLHLIVVASLYGFTSHDRKVKRLAMALIGMVVAQWAAGLINVFLLAPVWMQIVHLLLADTVWILLVLMVAGVLARAPQDEPFGMAADYAHL
ncbi:MAG: COX15/CtaA family protein [Chloroflexi bacterium]|nr:COX15/CtaA family protein [Chloroflexota bacterium]